MKKITILFILLLFVLIFQPVIIAPDPYTCEECEALYWASIGSYPEYEVKETLRAYGCDECPELAFVYGKSGSSPTSPTYDYYSDDGSACFIVLFVVIIAFVVAIFFVFRKKPNKQVVDRRCPECGRGIPLDAVVCPDCGKKFKVNYPINENDKT